MVRKVGGVALGFALQAMGLQDREDVDLGVGGVPAINVDMHNFPTSGDEVAIQRRSTRRGPRHRARVRPPAVLGMMRAMRPPAEQAAARRADGPILKRKIAVPATWPGAIDRPRPLAALAAALDAGRHVALVAGSGFGKSTLGADLARARGAAWVALDAEDAAPASFLAHLIAAIARARPEVRTEAGVMLDLAGDRAGALAVLATLVADLDEQLDPAAPLVVVLDDAHLAAAPTTDALIGRLIGYLPEAVRLVVASREEPGWGLRAHEAKRAIAVLGEADLAFDAAELAALVPDADAASRAALLAETGGWPAGMGLAPAARAAYLDEQVLRPLPDVLRAFLLRAALLDAFDAPLCEAAFGLAPDPARDEELLRRHLVERVGAGQLAVLPPLRGLLRERFHAALAPAERQALLGRLGDALLGRGQPATAIRLWCAAGHHERAADALVAEAATGLRRGELDVLAGMAAPLAEVVARADVQWVVGELARRFGDHDRAEAAFGRAAATAAAANDAGGAARARLGLAMAAAGAGRLEAAAARLAEARPDLPNRPEVLLDVTNLEGGLALLGGDPAAAQPHFEAALRTARALGDRYAELRAMHNLGVCHVRQGEPERALACYDAALAGLPAGAPPAIAMTPVNRALVLVDLGRAAEGREAAREALATARQVHGAAEEGYALRALGFASMKLGALDEAERCLLEAEQLATRTHDALGLAFTQGFLAELALERGEPAQAARAIAAAERALGGPDAMRAYPELRHVAAKVAARLGRHGELEAWIAELDGRRDVPGWRRMRDELTTAPAASPPAAPEAELQVRCFGALAVTVAGREVAEKDWQSARARALFVYLLHRPLGATRQHLTEELYGGEEPGESSLYMNFTRLRKALEPELDKGRPSRWILRREGAYRFNREGAFALDTEAFTRAMATARAAEGPAARQACEAALAAYHGDFFPECEMPWAIALRHGYREQALAACRALLPLYEAEGPVAVMALVRRALAIDPLSEEFHRELLLRHLEAGEHAQAREHYDLVVRRFREALDAEPPPDLAALVGGAP